jgi:hypothetical protein
MGIRLVFACVARGPQIWQARVSSGASTLGSFGASRARILVRKISFVNPACCESPRKSVAKPFFHSTLGTPTLRRAR